jgi:electron transfer flavoprotein beta subunit
VQVKLPAVLTADLRLNTPRYATLPNIMKAKKKPLTKLTPKDLEVDVTPRQQILKVSEPPKRQGGGKVASVEELAERIKKLGVA